MSLINKIRCSILKDLAKKNCHSLLGMQSFKYSTENTQTEGAATSNNENQVAKELEEKVKKLESEAADYKDRFLRAMADAENTRTRMRKEVDNAKVFGIQGFCKDLLEVADILNLAIQNTDPAKSAPNAASLNEQLVSMHKGLTMTEACLLKVFEKNGLTQIKPQPGDDFNPNLHEAVFRIKEEGKKSGSVSVITKIGFKLNERVIRAAQVGVVQ